MRVENLTNTLVRETTPLATGEADRCIRTERNMNVGFNWALETRLCNHLKDALDGITHSPVSAIKPRKLPIKIRCRLLFLDLTAVNYVSEV